MADRLDQAPVPRAGSRGKRGTYHSGYQSLLAVWRVLERDACQERPLSVGEVLEHLKKQGGACPSYGTVDNMLRQIYDLTPQSSRSADPEPGKVPAAELDSFPWHLECVIAERRGDRTVYTPYDQWENRPGGGERKLNQPRRYYLKSALSREEWRIFSDLVLLYPYITEAQTKKFLRVLDRLNPQHPPRAKSRYAFKRGSARQFQCIALLDQAIRERTAAAVRYGEYRLDRAAGKAALVQRERHGLYRLAPYALLWSNGYYYLVGKDLEQGGIMNLRADRILSVGLLKGETFDLPRDFDPAEHRDRSPVMYPGAPQFIRLRCRESLLNTLLDFFGPQARLQPMEEGWLQVTLNLAPSGVRRFALQYADSVEVLEPEELRRSVRETMEAALARYAGEEEQA